MSVRQVRVLLDLLSLHEESSFGRELSDDVGFEGYGDDQQAVLVPLSEWLPTRSQRMRLFAGPHLKHNMNLLLTPREKRILQLRYLLVSENKREALERQTITIRDRRGHLTEVPIVLSGKMKLAAIGLIYGLTRERVRQIINDAESKLRNGIPGYERDYLIKLLYRPH
jgi:hypothetical protein